MTACTKCGKEMRAWCSATGETLYDEACADAQEDACALRVQLREMTAERDALRTAGDILRASIGITTCPKHGDEREDGECLGCVDCDQVDSAKEYDAAIELLGGESTAERTRRLLLDGMKLAISLRDLRAEVLRVAEDLERSHLSRWAVQLRKAADT